MQIRTYPLGPIQTNCYLISNDDGQTLIIDPGEEAERIVREVEKERLQPVAILLTHAHFDHIGAVDAVRDHFSIPVYIHEEEKEWLTDPALNGSARYPMFPQIASRPADRFIEEGVFKVGSFELEARHTPGHSPGSVSFIFPEQGFAVVGDTLFMQSVGRTDLPMGDSQTLLRSIHGKLLSLDDHFRVYPGHGPATTVGDEKDSNPFLHGF